MAKKTDQIIEPINADLSAVAGKIVQSSPRSISIKNNILTLKRSVLSPPTLAQLELFHVERQIEIDGVEMGVLDNGIPYLTESGLARMCGIDRKVLNRLAINWVEERTKPRGRQISELLVHSGYSEDSLFLKSEHKGNEINAYTEPVCLAMLEYYAFLAEEKRDEAVKVFRSLARITFRTFIYKATGYSPDQKILDSWKHFHDRIDMTLDAVPFAQWLDAQGLNAPALRWYLDYCCRDDYGAGAAQVSAWAGIHYFASRHGFHAPGEANEERDAVLTWPEGNAWISRRLAAALGERLHSGCIALRVSEGRFDASVDVWNVRTSQAERWTAAQVVLAVPLFVAARLLEAPPAALTQAAAAMRYAPWLVANLELTQALDDRPGAPPSWDNVAYDAAVSGSAALGYVDAMHQSTRPHPGPTVLTAYWALGGESAAQLQAQRARLLNEPWAVWAQAVVADLARVHPDLPAKLRAVDLMRYGHAMSIPVPGLRSSAALRALVEPQRRVQFAHSDLSGYSVFEEALYQGQRAGVAAKRAASR